MTLFENDFFADIIVKVRSYWVRVGPNLVTSVLIRRRNGGTDTPGRPVKTKAEAGAVPLGLPRTAKDRSNHQKGQEGPAPEPSGGAWP